MLVAEATRMRFIQPLDFYPLLSNSDATQPVRSLQGG